MSLYEKKYNEALEWMRSLYDGLHGSTKEDAEHYFPELKESEDEKTRKQILSFLKDFERDHYRNLDFSSWIAWLEKQGEQVLANSAKTCKVEQKFKVGDWVVHNNANVYQVKKIDYTAPIPRYELKNIDEDRLSVPFTSDYSLRNWTINDAKDGDVLVCPKYAGDIIPIIFIFKEIKIKNNDVFCYCSFLETFRRAGYVASADPIDTDFYPATKEQRDLLFQKMKEEGYKWDTDKKELKKIEQSNEESNEGNFEIDDLYCAKTILEKTLGKVEGYQTDDGILEHKSAINAVTKLCDKISRGTRINWEPSDEQVEAFEHFVRSIGEVTFVSPYDSNTKLVYSLLSDLKKLKEK